MGPFILYAARHRLEAVSISELAELCVCALRAGDRITAVRVCDPSERHLGAAEMVRLLGEIARQRGVPRG